jgi:aspartate/methionine/tyrosine aminotransferase
MSLTNEGASSTKRLNAIDGFQCGMPNGAFYAFPNISAFGMSSEEFAGSLL